MSSKLEKTFLAVLPSKKKNSAEKVLLKIKISQSAVQKIKKINSTLSVSNKVKSVNKLKKQGVDEN